MPPSRLTTTCLALFACGALITARQGPTLTAQDRAEIQELVARYQTALTTCASQEYASLFVPDGVFISDDFRGKRHRELYGPNGGTLVGRAKLAELVDTEDFCIDKSQRRASSAATAPAVVIVPAPGGAKGTVQLPIRDATRTNTSRRPTGGASRSARSSCRCRPAATPTTEW